MNVVDLNGGEFEDAEKFCIPLDQILLLVDKIGNLLVALKPELKDPHKIPFYCFRVASDNRPMLMLILRTLLLPKGCSLYECDGRILFDLRDASGGVVTACCFYLIVR